MPLFILLDVQGRHIMQCVPSVRVILRMDDDHTDCTIE